MSFWGRLAVFVLVWFVVSFVAAPYIGKLLAHAREVSTREIEK